MLISVSSLFLSLFLGLIAACLSWLFMFSVEQFYLYREQYPYILFGLIVYFVLHKFVFSKMKSFPKKVKELHEYDANYTVIWNSWMAVYNFCGALLSHLFGASVGREGVIVLTLSGVVNFLRLNLRQWVPVAASIGFGTIVGSPLAAVVFAIEMFTTQFVQKIYIYLGSFFGVLFLKHLKFKHLLISLELFSDQNSILNDFSKTPFFTRLLFIVLLVYLASALSQLYKLLVNQIKKIDHKLWLSLFLVSLMTLALWAFKESAYLESFGDLFLNQIHQFLNFQNHLNLESLNTASIFTQDFYKTNFVVILLAFVLLKVVLTAFFVGMGFLGGEYVPLVIAGSVFGVLTAYVTGENIYFGYLVGSFIIFSGVSKLKWTCFILFMSLTGWNYFWWGLILFNWVDRLSGDTGTYLDETKKKSSFQFNTFNSAFNTGFGTSYEAFRKYRANSYQGSTGHQDEPFENMRDVTEVEIVEDVSAEDVSTGPKLINPKKNDE